MKSNSYGKSLKIPSSPNLNMSDYESVMDIVFGRWKSQITYAGVKLGIFDILNSPMSADEIAQKLDLDSNMAYRLLRALASIQLLREDNNSIFSINSKGKFLRKDHPQTLQAVTLLEEGPEHNAIWKHLSEMIKDGKQDGFIREYGQKVFEYASKTPSYSKIFNQAMSSYSTSQTKLVLDALDGYDFSVMQNLCDVGGGQGHLLCNFLLRYDHLKGTVLDLEQSFKEKESLWGNKLDINKDRCSYIVGDMFREIPHADGYLLKFILHDWNDEECVRILSNIQKASSKGSRIFIIEQIIPKPEISHFSKIFDIHMLCIVSGKERTEEEYLELLQNSGFSYVKTHYPQSRNIGVIEGVKS